MKAPAKYNALLSQDSSIERNKENKLEFLYFLSLVVVSLFFLVVMGNNGLMRRFLFNQAGEIDFYITGAGVIFDVLNQPVGIVQADINLLDSGLEPVTGAQGDIIAWFDDAFLWSLEGELLAFIKGAKPEAELVLPVTQKLAFVPEPKAAPFKPLLSRAEPPVRQWQWAQQKLVFNSQEFFA